MGLSFFIFWGWKYVWSLLNQCGLQIWVGTIIHDPILIQSFTQGSYLLSNCPCISDSNDGVEDTNDLTSSWLSMILAAEGRHLVCGRDLMDLLLGIFVADGLGAGGGGGAMGRRRSLDGPCFLWPCKWNEIQNEWLLISNRVSTGWQREGVFWTP